MTTSRRGLEAHLDREPDPGLVLDPRDVQPSTPADPVSPMLFGHLTYRVAADSSDDALVAGLAAWQRIEGCMASRQWVDVAELHARFTAAARARLDLACDVGDEFAAEEAADDLDLANRSVVAEIAAALSWSQSRTSGQVEVALVLTSTLTATLDAVSSGAIDVRRAEVIARALRREEGDLARLVEAEILPDASGWNAPELRERVKKALLRAAPELAAQRAERARKGRAVSFKAEADDMVRLEALLPVEDGIRVQAALDVAALDQKQAEQEARAGHEGAGPDREVRGLDEIRADVLVDAILGLAEGLTDDTEADRSDADGSEADGSHAGGGLAQADGSSADPDSATYSPTTRPAKAPRTGAARPRPRSRRAPRHEIVLTVPFETITGDADEPGYLARYGPVSAHIARKLAFGVAADGYWRCAVTDDVHGTLLGLGRSTFTPAYAAPEYLRRFTDLRHRTCDFPGCRVPAAACDFDHTVPHPAGATCECGGAKRCRSHHRLKHRTRWRVRRSENPEHPPGTHVWTSPIGREYASRPAVVGVPEPAEAAFTDSGEPPY